MASEAAKIQSILLPKLTHVYRAIALLFERVFPKFGRNCYIQQNSMLLWPIALAIFIEVRFLGLCLSLACKRDDHWTAAIKYYNVWRHAWLCEAVKYDNCYCILNVPLL